MSLTSLLSSGWDYGRLDDKGHKLHQHSKITSKHDSNPSKNSSSQHTTQIITHAYKEHQLHAYKQGRSQTF